MSDGTCSESLLQEEVVLPGDQSQCRDQPSPANLVSINGNFDLHSICKRISIQRLLYISVKYTYFIIQLRRDRAAKWEEVAGMYRSERGMATVRVRTPASLRAIQLPNDTQFRVRRCSVYAYTKRALWYGDAWLCSCTYKPRHSSLQHSIGDIAGCAVVAWVTRGPAAILQVGQPSRKANKLGWTHHRCRVQHGRGSTYSLPNVNAGPSPSWKQVSQNINIILGRRPYLISIVLIIGSYFFVFVLGSF